MLNDYENTLSIPLAIGIACLAVGCGGTSDTTTDIGVIKQDMNSISNQDLGSSDNGCTRQFKCFTECTTASCQNQCTPASSDPGAFAYLSVTLCVQSACNSNGSCSSFSDDSQACISCQANLGSMIVAHTTATCSNEFATCQSAN